MAKEKKTKNDDLSHEQLRDGWFEKLSEKDWDNFRYTIIKIKGECAKDKKAIREMEKLTRNDSGLSKSYKDYAYGALMEMVGRDWDKVMYAIIDDCAWLSSTRSKRISMEMLDTFENARVKTKMMMNVTAKLMTETYDVDVLRRAMNYLSKYHPNEDEYRLALLEAHERNALQAQILILRKLGKHFYGDETVRRHIRVNSQTGSKMRNKEARRIIEREEKKQAMKQAKCEKCDQKEWHVWRDWDGEGPPDDIYVVNAISSKEAVEEWKRTHDYNNGEERIFVALPGSNKVELHRVYSIPTITYGSEKIEKNYE